MVNVEPCSEQTGSMMCQVSYDDSVTIVEIMEDLNTSYPSWDVAFVEYVNEDNGSVCPSNLIITRKER